MYTSETIIDWHQISFTMYGFDRPSFVNDIADCIPLEDTCQIKRLSFEANGIEARGELTLRITQRQLADSIAKRLKAVPGMVNVQPDQNHWATAHS